MNKRVSEILRSVKSFPGFNSKYNFLFGKSEQVVIFGSYASGVQRSQSDIDILFVTDEKGYKSKYLDFVCIEPKRIKLRTWLGTELANHVAQYGLWVKGDDSWRKDAVISKEALDRKKLMILHRLSHLYVKGNRISESLMLTLFQDVVLDSFRLIQMSEGFPVPANKILIDRFIQDKRNILDEIVKTKYLGRIGEAYFDELFQTFNKETLSQEVKSLMQYYR
jgi:predicted nucleotidyltransferase